MLDLCAIGNALVDILVSTDDSFLAANKIVKGTMRLVEKDEAQALFNKAGPAVELSSGGSAANTLSGASSLGASCAFLGKVGRDAFGEAFRRDLQAQNIRHSTPPSSEKTTGHCLIFVTADAQRSMNTYLGAATEFGPEDVTESIVQEAAITYMEGYLFDKAPAQQAFDKAATLAHEAGRKTAMTLSDVFCVVRHRDAFLNLIRQKIDIVFANESELKEFSQTQDFSAALAAARALVPLLVVTRGGQGAVIASGAETVDVSATSVANLVDTTGAGDLFAAGFLYGLVRGQALAECGRIGAVAAAEVISHFGPRPQKKLKDLMC